MRRSLLAVAWMIAGCSPDSGTVGEEPPSPLPPHAVSVAEAAALPWPSGRMSASATRGRERYAIFCTPCHGRTGHGNGKVVQAGFPAPPSFSRSARRLSPEEIVEVITHGKGAMRSMAERIPPVDRFAIAYHVETLQVEGSAPERPASGSEPAR